MREQKHPARAFLPFIRNLHSKSDGKFVGSSDFYVVRKCHGLLFLFGFNLKRQAPNSRLTRFSTVRRRISFDFVVSLRKSYIFKAYNYGAVICTSVLCTNLRFVLYNAFKPVFVFRCKVGITASFGELIRIKNTEVKSIFICVFKLIDKLPCFYL